MKQTTLREHFASLISGLLVAGVLLTAAPSAWACAGGDDCDDGSCNSIFSPEIIGDPTCTPFFRSNRYFYLNHDDISDQTHADLDAANLREWSTLLGFSSSALEELVYKSTSADVLAIKQELLNPSNPSRLTGNNLAIYMVLAAISNHALAVDALTYLDFAKRVEPYATVNLGQGGPWGTPVGPALASPDPLIQEGIAAVSTTANPSLKARYAFQVTRLYYYNQRYEEAYNYYDLNAGILTANVSIYFRALDLAAGSLYKAQKYAQANYIFAQIFDQYPPLKKEAYLSFHPQEQADWQQSLALAKNDKEKIALWSLFGIYADGVEAIRQIYAIDPKAQSLLLLVVREVNKAEEGFQWNNYQDSVVTADNFALISQLQQIVASGNEPKPYVWELALGHVYGLAGDATNAESYLNQAKLHAPPANPAVADQIRISTFFAKVHALQAPSTALEPYIAGELKWLASSTQSFPETRGQVLLGYAKTSLSKVYLSSGDWLKATLLDDTDSTSTYLDSAKLDALIAYLKANHHSNAFEDVLVKGYVLTVENLNEMKGINLAYANDFTSAADFLAKIGASEPLMADPFLIHIQDCHDCDHDALTTKLYSKAQFAKAMAAYIVKAAGTGQAAAQASFMVANGYYNMSYYGNARDFYETPVWNYSSAARQNNQAMAEKYYAQALRLSNDKEFKAKVTWMLAKCEQNDYFNRLPEDEDPVILTGFYYHQFKKNFAHTNYYQEVLNECGYFKKFVTNNP